MKKKLPVWALALLDLAAAAVCVGAVLNHLCIFLLHLMYFGYQIVLLVFYHFLNFHICK